MATLAIKSSVVNIGAGTYTVEIILRDAAGTVMDSSIGEPITIPEGEVIELDVTIPEVIVQTKGHTRPPGTKLPQTRV